MLIILIVIIILILINGFFAAAEMALVSVKPSDLHRLKEEGHKNALILENMTKSSTEYLSTIQVAITFAGFLSSAFAGSQFSSQLVNLLGSWGITMSNGLAVVLITLVLSFFTLVFGELVPKKIALNNAEKLALFCAPVIRVLMIIFKPFVWLLSISTKAVLKVFGFKQVKEDQEFTEKKLKEMIVYGHIKGLYDFQEKKMLQRIFRFDDLTVEMIMTPIDLVVGLRIDEANETMVNKVVESRYSRIPVFGKDKDDILGVILVKDLALELSQHKPSDISVNKLLREPYIIEEDLSISELFSKMKDTSQHLAFVVDEDDHTLGIVTLEDIIEEIVGSIYDEHDEVTEVKEHRNHVTYNVDGSMTLKELKESLGIAIVCEEKGIVDINDYVKNRVGKISSKSKGKVFQFELGLIEIIKVSKDHVDQVRLFINEKEID